MSNQYSRNGQSKRLVSEMASISRLKEEIGWLKVWFGLLAVIDASLLGWLAQSYTAANALLLFVACIAILVVSTSIYLIDQKARRCIKDIEET